MVRVCVCESISVCACVREREMAADPQHHHGDKPTMDTADGLLSFAFAAGRRLAAASARSSALRQNRLSNALMSTGTEEAAVPMEHTNKRQAVT